MIAAAARRARASMVTAPRLRIAAAEAATATRRWSPRGRLQRLPLGALSYLRSPWWWSPSLSGRRQP
jgi:hypothetical protein